MSLNPAVFRTRSLTAAVFVIVMLTGLLWTPWSFLVLFSLIQFGCWIEYQKIMALIDKEYAGISGFHRYSVMIAGWCLMLYLVNGTLLADGIPLRVFGWWGCLGFLAVFVIGEIIQIKTINFKNIGRSALGLLFGAGLPIDKIFLLFTIVFSLVQFTGCVFFTWTSLKDFVVFQVITLLNPVTYACEGLRYAMVPPINGQNAATLPIAWVVIGLIAFFVVFLILGMRAFRKRAIS